MTTFSQLVDRIAIEVVRPDMIGLLPQYLNQTIRDVHSNARTNMPVFFEDNRVEHELEIDSLIEDTGAFVWVLPRPTQLQQVEAIYYVDSRVYATKVTPQSSFARNDVDVNQRFQWYRVANSLVMTGAGCVGSKVKISLFQYPRSLAYFRPSERTFTYDEVNDMYLVRDGVDPIAAHDSNTNWLLERYAETLAEGVRAKIYKRMADEGRARMAYSQFESARLSLQLSESSDHGVTFRR
jgi:hypothetical protein